MRIFIDLCEGQSGESYFDPTALANARGQNDKSRELLIEMSPREFLSLALPGYDEGKEAGVAAAIQQGVKFRDLPFLSFEHDGEGTAHITGHEGRHRAQALEKLGVERMPVIFRSQASANGQSMRWGSLKDGIDRFRDIWPSRLISEDRRTIFPFPVPSPFPHRGDMPPVEHPYSVVAPKPTKSYAYDRDEIDDLMKQLMGEGVLDITRRVLDR